MSEHRLFKYLYVGKLVKLANPAKKKIQKT